MIKFFLGMLILPSSYNQSFFFYNRDKINSSNLVYNPPNSSSKTNFLATYNRSNNTLEVKPLTNNMWAQKEAGIVCKKYFICFDLTSSANFSTFGFLEFYEFLELNLMVDYKLADVQNNFK